ncbi:Aldehyde dehydrogenase [Pseudocercospora fuligena]|uniref:aldehyde dehydrogenase (NAD(+)) n=1 Tax=Pseudocercospora fuligena TaxID=685502 RepID=A0A8H6RGX7_9PEZI|nr:Aldehyde dehydrogenase [Pseudocercospora fuligena]
MSYETRLFINGEYVQGSSGETLTIHSPNDDSLVTDKIQVASEQDVDKAVAAAKAAFPAWRDMAGHKRAAIMNKFADLLEANIEKLAKLESAAMGQPVSVAKRMILGPVALWRYYAGYAGKIAGESFPPDEDGTYKIVQYEPLGVCAGICAWNGTHVLAAWKMAPAMAAGNTFILKSSEKSPLAVCEYGNLLNQAGFPKGVINIITGAGPVGSLLAHHMQISKIAFTGSAPAGRAVMAAAAKSNLKKVSLELGGKSPALIFDDAELDNAVEHSSTSFLRNSGQICFAASRVLVQENIAPQFIEKIKTAFEKAEQQMGDPSSADTAFGPLADKKQFERVMSFMDGAREEGVQVLVGGERKGDKGTFVKPTIFLNPDVKSKVYTDEIFGPAISVRTFKTEEEAIELANNTTYGLGSTIYTSDIARALRVASKLEAGTVGINSAFNTSPQTPFGGFKQSGYGRESGPEGLKEYLQPKTIHVNLNVKPPKR